MPTVGACVYIFPQFASSNTGNDKFTTRSGAVSIKIFWHQIDTGFITNHVQLWNTRIIKATVTRQKLSKSEATCSTRFTMKKEF